MRTLVIGGSGIIGTAMAKEAVAAGWNVTTIGVYDSPALPTEVRRFFADRSQPDFAERVTELSQIAWDVIVDVIPYDQHSVEQTFQLFTRVGAPHLFFLSTTLVYDRSQPSGKPIPDTARLACSGTMGGYVDGKLAVEQAVRQCGSFWPAWTILRPYHVLGTGSLLGCIPDENRDPGLLQKIRNGTSLGLCNGGAILTSFVAAQDLARVIIRAARNCDAFSRAFNVVHPEPVRARTYYETIGTLVGRKPAIGTKSLRDVWREQYGWELTTLPHVYDVSALRATIGYAPNTSLCDVLAEVIAAYPKEERSLDEIPVHRHMTALPRPKIIPWLFEAGCS